MCLILSGPLADEHTSPALSPSVDFTALSLLLTYDHCVSHGQSAVPLSSLIFWLKFFISFFSPCFSLLQTRWSIFYMLVSFHIPCPLQLLGCVRVYVFFSAQIREELKLTSISAARLAFISSARVNGERNRKT